MADDLVAMNQALVAQPQNQQSNSYMGGAIASRQSTELIKWEIDVKDVVHEEKQDLLGTQFNIRTRSYEQIFPQMMSEEAIHKLFAFTKFDFSKNLVLSSHTEEQIKDNVEEYESVMSLVLHRKAAEWGIQGNLLTPLRAMFGRAALATYNRSLGGNTAKLLRDTQSHTEVITNQAGQKRSFLGQLMKGGVR